MKFNVQSFVVEFPSVWRQAISETQEIVWRHLPIHVRRHIPSFLQPTQAQKLQIIVADYLSQTNQQPQASFPVLLATNNTSFRVAQVSIDKIDPAFAQAQKMTQRVVRQILSEKPDSKLQELIVSFEEKQLQSIGNMIPCMDKYLTLIHSECSINATARLHDLFIAFKNCIESQEKLYDLDPSRKYESSPGQLSHEELFRAKIDEAQKLKSQVEARFPGLFLPLLLKSESFAQLDAIEPSLEQTGRFLGPLDTQAAIESQKSHSEIWSRFRFADGKAYFTALIEELRKYKSFEEVPTYLQQAFYQSKHIDVGMLFALPMFQNSVEACLNEFEKCTSFETLLFDPENCRKGFLARHFTDIVSRIRSQKGITLDFSVRPELVLQDMYQSEITDELLLQLPEINIQGLCISGATLAGSCLLQDRFKNLSKLSLIGCEFLNEEYLEKLSSDRLVELDLSCNQITGRSLQAKCFEKLTKLRLVGCGLLQEEYLENLSSDKLVEFNLSETHVTGRSLQAKCFGKLKRLYLSSCRLLNEEYLEKLSSDKLVELDLGETYVTGRSLQAKCFEKLSRLSLTGCKAVQDEYLEKLSSNHLAELDLGDTRITGRCLQAKCFEKLSRLSLSRCSLLKEEYLEKLSSDHLRQVDLSYTNITGKSLTARCFEKLVKLCLNSCRLLKDEYLEKLLSHELVDLELAKTNITGRSLMVQCFEKLAKLDLFNCQFLQEEYLEKLSSHELVDLDLGHTNVTGRSLMALCFEKLTKLSLFNCQLLQEEYLKKMSSNHLAELDLGDTRITGRILIEKCFEKLIKLNLSGCKFLSDKYLAMLSSHHLQQLDLSNTDITGWSLMAKCFEEVIKLDLSDCEFLEEEYLEKLLATSNFLTIDR